MLEEKVLTLLYLLRNPPRLPATTSDISVTETITETEIIDPALTETETETMLIYETEIL